MSIEALRKKKRMRRPRPRLTDGQKSAVLLALTFFEVGWSVSPARIVASPVRWVRRSDDNRLARIGCRIAARVRGNPVEVGWRWNSRVSSLFVCRATRCRRGVPASTTGTR